MIMKYSELTPKEKKILDDLHEHIEARALTEIGEFFASMLSEPKKKVSLGRIFTVKDHEKGNVIEHAYKKAKDDYELKVKTKDYLLNKNTKMN